MRSNSLTLSVLSILSVNVNELSRMKSLRSSALQWCVSLGIAIVVLPTTHDVNSSVVSSIDRR